MYLYFIQMYVEKLIIQNLKDMNPSLLKILTDDACAEVKRGINDPINVQRILKVLTF